MSRSGYSDDCENLGLYRQAVQRAISGKRGQAFLKEMATALDVMPARRLISGDIVRDDGSCCAIGSVAVARGKGRDDLMDVVADDGDDVARFFGVARSLACEIAYENDEQGPCGETPEQRWTRMRAWVAEQLGEERRGE